MRLAELLDGLNVPCPESAKSLDVSHMTDHTDEVEPGCLFAALPGVTDVSGERFIDQAIAKGAAIILKSPGAAKESINGVCVIETEAPRELFKTLLVRLYGNPSQHIKVIGITGTNGKTTVAHLIDAILSKVQTPCGMVGTVNHRIGKDQRPSRNTTPGLVEIHRLLADMVKAKCAYCIMEVSSHALHQGRVDLVDFHDAVFTNLTQDHLDYHVDMESYFEAKASLFDRLSDYAKAFVNIDDPYGQKLVKRLKTKVITYGIKHMADIRAEVGQAGLGGTTLSIITAYDTYHMETQLIGLHNVYNALAAVAVGISEGVPFEIIAEALSTCPPVKGRLERLPVDRPFHVFVDYAHTEDGLQNVLLSLRPLVRGRLITVFGCGGDRDRGKRPKMAAVCEKLSDVTIVTSDNPRTESARAIIDDILKGFSKDAAYDVVVDRRDAIGQALKMAQPNDLILLAGKGHETYQTIGTRSIPFDERVVVKELLT